MKEIPMIFNTEMVTAILEGRKTMTRRILKGIPLNWDYINCAVVNTNKGCEYRGFFTAKGARDIRDNKYVKPPFGVVGDRIWVKETTINVEDHGYEEPIFLASENGQACIENGLAPTGDDFIEVEPYDLRLRPSIFMKKEWARIWLEITSVKIERLNQISEEDANKEGVKPVDFGYGPSYGAGFCQLWESIYGTGSFDASWTWVYEFKQVEA